jgi:hypothetical protein
MPTEAQKNGSAQCGWMQPYPDGGLLACRKSEGHSGSHRPYKWARDHMGYSPRARWEPPHHFPNPTASGTFTIDRTP